MIFRLPLDASSNDLWQILTGHRAIFAYAVILLIALIALMLLFIIRYAKDAEAKEKERKLTAEKRRFSRLCELDDGAGKEGAEQFEECDNLSQLCERFRDFAASRMGLYYDIGVIRAFVSSLAVGRLIIMQGISGTGKTSLAYAFGKFIGNDTAIMPVQPSWKDKTDMIGYYNEFTGNFTETELLYVLYRANMSGGVYIIVLDEMNIARVEYYFAEFLSVLELPDLSARKIEIVSDVRANAPKLFDDGKLTVPDNVWFVGTANNDDSTLSISDKVYDRSSVIELQSRARPFAAKNAEPLRVSADGLKELFSSAALAFPVSEDLKNKIERIDACMSKRLQITFGNRIMRQTLGFIPVYRACGGSEYEALDLILCKKVLRKLESLNPVYVAAEAEGMIGDIRSVFGDGAMPACTAYLRKYVKI